MATRTAGSQTMNPFDDASIGYDAQMACGPIIRKAGLKAH